MKKILIVLSLLSVSSLLFAVQKCPQCNGDMVTEYSPTMYITDKTFNKQYICTDCDYLITVGTITAIEKKRAERKERVKIQNLP